MMSQNMTALEAIARSQSHSETVTLTYTALLAADLYDACDGESYDAGRRVHKYWGGATITDVYGGEWRVHLKDAPR